VRERERESNRKAARLSKAGESEAEQRENERREKRD
jgi:hypothetical protein